MIDLSPFHRALAQLKDQKAFDRPEGYVNPLMWLGERAERLVLEIVRLRHEGRLAHKALGAKDYEEADERLVDLLSLPCGPCSDAGGAERTVYHMDPCSPEVEENLKESTAVYERFTDRARKGMQLANQEAQRFNHEYVGTEHVLLGLVEEGRGVAANVLKNLGVDLRKIRLEVEKVLQRGPGEPQITGRLPHTPRTKSVIEHTIREAREIGANYVGTEHLLLGLLAEAEGVAGQVLTSLGLTPAAVREEILRLLAARPAVGGITRDALADAVATLPAAAAAEQAFGRSVVWPQDLAKVPGYLRELARQEIERADGFARTCPYAAGKMVGLGVVARALLATLDAAEGTPVPDQAAAAARIASLELDVRRLEAVAADRAQFIEYLVARRPPGAVDCKYGEVTVANKRFHPGEPVFVLRAADALAAEQVMDYARKCEDVGCTSAHSEGALEAAYAMRKWQAENAGLVKKPD